VPSIAQERSQQDPSGYASVLGGAVWASGNSTGTAIFEGGVRIAPHVSVFGNVGRFANLLGDLQPTLDATANAAANQGLAVTGSGTLPAWYGVGGLRAEIPVSAHLFPYVLAGAGAARLKPSAQFAYASGTLPDGSTPDPGADVTSSLVSSGALITPAPSSAFMFMMGGGVQIPLVSRWAVDLGYRYSHLAADSSLTASPLNTNAMTFGFGYRF
jgi:opacity protein-like surface antigen